MKGEIREPNLESFPVHARTHARTYIRTQWSRLGVATAAVAAGAEAAAGTCFKCQSSAISFAPLFKVLFFFFFLAARSEAKLLVEEAKTTSKDFCEEYPVWKTRRCGLKGKGETAGVAVIGWEK